MFGKTLVDGHFVMLSQQAPQQLESQESVPLQNYQIDGSVIDPPPFQQLPLAVHTANDHAGSIFDMAKNDMALNVGSSEAMYLSDALNVSIPETLV